MQILHKRSGVSVDIADIGHQIGDDWFIGQNWDTTRATLSKGRIHITMFKLVPKSDRNKVKPEFLERVQKGPRSSPSETGQDAHGDPDDDEDDQAPDDDGNDDASEEESDTPGDARQPPPPAAPAAKRRRCDSEAATSGRKKIKLSPLAHGDGSALAVMTGTT